MSNRKSVVRDDDTFFKNTPAGNTASGAPARSNSTERRLAAAAAWIGLVSGDPQRPGFAKRLRRAQQDRPVRSASGGRRDQPRRGDSARRLPARPQRGPRRRGCRRCHTPLTLQAPHEQAKQRQVRTASARLLPDAVESRAAADSVPSSRWHQDLRRALLRRERPGPASGMTAWPASMPATSRPARTLLRSRITPRRI